MSLDSMFSTINISGSGLSAERLRMEVIANNIANASSTRTPEGGPFRRQDVVFHTALKDAMGARGAEDIQQLGGVKTTQIIEDQSEMPRVYNPGHPDADAEGFVTMPNVHLPIEMVNLVTATRSYEAGLKVISSFKSMSEQALRIME